MPEAQEPGRPRLLFKEIPWLPLADLGCRQPGPFCCLTFALRLNEDTAPVRAASGPWEAWGFGEGRDGVTVAFLPVGPGWGHVSGVFGMQLAGAVPSCPGFSAPAVPPGAFPPAPSSLLETEGAFEASPRRYRLPRNKGPFSSEHSLTFSS